MRIVGLGAGMVLASALGAFLAFSAAVAWWPYPAGIDGLPSAATWIEDRSGTALAALAADDGQWRFPLDDRQISPHLLDAFIAVEDARFESHHGVDWKSIAASAWQDLTHLRIVRGGSTITMQLQRLRDCQPRTLLCKLVQAIRAEQLERRQSKQQILVEYVNRAPFGGNLVGAGAASWRYYGRPCRQLSLAQAALLAGLPQSPDRLRPDRFPNRAKVRRDHVLDRMLACGFISRKQHDEAVAEPVDAVWHRLPQDVPRASPTPSNEALPMLLRQAHENPGQTVTTTLDTKVQQLAENALRDQLQSLRGFGVSAGAVVVLDTQSAQCLAAASCAGGHNLIDLTECRRSTGSTLKPFIYAAAFDAGVCGPRSILSDTIAAWPGYQPSDYDHEYRGPITAAEALAESRNIPAMLVLAKVGVDTAVSVMDAAGLHGLTQNPRRYGLSLAIGGAEASPLEIAEAYATLARGGVSRPATFVLTDASTTTDQSPDATPAGAINVEARCLRTESCWKVLNALSGVDRTSSVCPEAFRSHAAWKTGTSSGRRDAWCAAVTRRRTVVVWLGNLDNAPSTALVGQEAAAPLALRIIAALDPTDDPWPITADSSPPQLASDHLSPSRLVLVHPTDGQEFVITGDVPLAQQRILLEALGSPSSRTGALWWFVDDNLIRSMSSSASPWWDPTPGAHTIGVIDSAGHSATARILVRAPTNDQ